MLQEEFESRVGISVSPEEYWEMLKEYNRSPLCKDDFCAAWVARNRGRVAAFKAAERERVARVRMLWALREILSGLHASGRKGGYYVPAVPCLNKRQARTLEKAGLRVCLANGRPRVLFDVVRDLEGLVSSL